MWHLIRGWEQGWSKSLIHYSHQRIWPCTLKSHGQMRTSIIHYVLVKMPRENVWQNWEYLAWTFLHDTSLYQKYLTKTQHQITIICITYCNWVSYVVEIRGLLSFFVNKLNAVAMGLTHVELVECCHILTIYSHFKLLTFSMLLWILHGPSQQ